MEGQSQTIAPPPSGWDALRILFIPPQQPPRNPACGHPELDERPPTTLRVVPRIVKSFEEMGYTFLRVERKPHGLHSTRVGEWPWEEIAADPTTAIPSGAV